MVAYYLTGTTFFGILIKKEACMMGYVALIGLIFAPFVSLLCAGWFYVRWQNEADETLAMRNRKICFRFLIAAAICLAVFGVLKLIFPIV